MVITRAASTTMPIVGISTVRRARWCSSRQKRQGQMGIGPVRFVGDKMEIRPYVKYSINELSYTYSINKNNYTVLKNIFIELRYRNGSESLELMNKIKECLKTISGKTRTSRPYFRLSTGKLAQILADNINNYSVLTDVYIELYERTNPEAIHLKEKIEKKIDSILEEKPIAIVQLSLIDSSNKKFPTKDIPVQLNLLK